MFAEKTKQCCYPEKYPCPSDTECIKYTCVPSYGSKYYYCKKELRTEVVGYAARTACTDNCPDNVICCIPGKPYPVCQDKYKTCNQETYICE